VGECLEEWLPSRMLLCPWSSLPRVLKDEDGDRQLADTAEGVERVTADAVNLVLVDASGRAPRSASAAGSMSASSPSLPRHGSGTEQVCPAL
jgi:hypothetical protein